MVWIADSETVDTIMSKTDAYVIGEIVSGERGVTLA
jgi:hypothetical protein